MILYAPNINSGGGLVLLNTVIEDEVFGKVTHLFIDKRCPLQFSQDDIIIEKVNPSLISRIYAEYKLKKLAFQNKEKEIVCFGNLPPLFKHKNNTKVFLQNAYLLRTIKLPRKIKNKLRIAYEKFIFYFFIKNVDQIIVQIEWMKENLKNYVNKDIQVKKILPVLPQSSSNEFTGTYDIIILTNNEEHKNYKIIKSALNKLDINLKICLISDTPPNINNRLITVHYYNNLNRNDIFKLYWSSSAILLTSSFESFCLPLYEAQHFKLKTIAPIAGYTKNLKIDYLFPSITEQDIITIIKKFMKDEGKSYEN
ncbi:glycosyltransferase [Halobacteriovorax sp. CON-3]|uniref:glycosyltransferase n=1 Tax=Halobacteriovorax sp. CON-3 TaxID=3157710 RepID=UPI003718B494